MHVIIGFDFVQVWCVYWVVRDLNMNYAHTAQVRSRKKSLIILSKFRTAWPWSGSFYTARGSIELDCGITAGSRMTFKSCDLSKIRMGWLIATCINSWVAAMYRSFISCAELNPVQTKCFSTVNSTAWYHVCSCMIVYVALWIRWQCSNISSHWVRKDYHHGVCHPETVHDGPRSDQEDRLHCTFQSIMQRAVQGLELKDAKSLPQMYNNRIL